MTDREYLALLYSHLPFGPKRVNLLISYFGNAKKAWNANEKKLIEVGIANKSVSEFFKYKESIKEKGYFENLLRLGIKFVTINDSDYGDTINV